MIRAAVVPELPGSLDRIDAGVPPPGGLVRLVAITAGAGTASVLLSSGTGSSAPASPGPAPVAAANLIRIN
jgi:hypothetical protein